MRSVYPEQSQQRGSSVPPTAPEHGTIRGMFFNFVIDFERKHGVAPAPRKRCIPFKSYPVDEYTALVDQVAQAVLPQSTVADARRQIGMHVYPAFTETLVGTAILAVAGHDWNRVIMVGPKAYEVSLSPGSVEVTLNRPGNALVKLRNVWTYVDTLHHGIWLGAMKRCGVVGTIDVDLISRCDADFLVQWKV